MADQGDIVEIAAEGRAGSGTRAARRLRRSGWLPCNLNLVDGSTRSLQVNQHDFDLTMTRRGGGASVIDLKTDTGVAKVLLREVQRHPLDGRALHVDFLEISMTKMLRVEVPIEIVGEDECPAVQQGDVLETLIRSVEIECVPTSMPEKIEVDVSALTTGEAVHVSDLVVADDVTILTDGETAVAHVAASRVTDEVAPEAEAEAEDAGDEGAAPADGDAAGDEEK